MLMRLRTAHFRFVYTFDSGHELVGVAEGDYFANSPHLVFNLRSLKAICLDPIGNLLASFDTGFGQFSITSPEVLFSGSHSDRGTFFSFNYRSGEAAIYDGTTHTWIASGWEPERWSVEALDANRAKPLMPVAHRPRWIGKVSA